MTNLAKIRILSAIAGVLFVVTLAMIPPEKITHIDMSDSSLYDITFRVKEKNREQFTVTYLKYNSQQGKLALSDTIIIVLVIPKAGTNSFDGPTWFIVGKNYIPDPEFIAAKMYTAHVIRIARHYPTKGF